MDEQFQVDMDEFLPLRDVVFNTLRKAILTGTLKPGERLMEVHLANKLGVSRTPVREAFRQLELERHFLSCVCWKFIMMKVNQQLSLHQTERL